MDRVEEFTQHCVGLLDPRPFDAEGAIPDSVRIPVEELPHRTFELPPESAELPVAAVEPWGEQAISALARIGRRAVAKPCASSPGPLDMRARLWQPNPFLLEALRSLRPGRAVDYACGSGRDAVGLACCGWKVTAIDHLPDALQRAAMLESRYAPAWDAEPIEWLCRDLEADDLGIERPCDLAVMFRFLHRPLIEQIVEHLEPGGSFLLETFTAEHRKTHGKPRTERFVVWPGELERMAKGLELRHCSEEWRGPSHTARLWAVKS